MPSDIDVPEPSDEEILAHLEKASRIGKRVKAHAQKTVKAGLSLLQFAEDVEALTRKEGGAPAFPANLSRNDEAAHYTPSPNDARVFGDKDVAKIDLGVHVNGSLVDFAFTVDFGGENGKLVEAADQALENALAVIQAGVPVSKPGREIEQAIRKAGFKPIANLGGHSIEPYVVHAGISLPNVETGSYEFQEGDVFACEPFATDGRGSVNEGQATEIYSLTSGARPRLDASRKILAHAAEHYKLLPFARRWLSPLSGEGLASLALRELERLGALHTYPVLKERPGAFVAQAETTFVVEKNGVRVLV